VILSDILSGSVANSICPAIGHHKGEGDENPGKSPFSAIGLKMGNLSIIDTTPTSITFEAHVNFTNPTNYSATIPYFNINILENGTVIGQAIVENLYVRPGNNSNLAAKAVWAPFTHSGDKGRAIGRELLSQYVSGTPSVFPTPPHSTPLTPTRLQHLPNRPNSQGLCPLTALHRPRPVPLPPHLPLPPPLQPI
jgi:hypothetical protein